MSSTSSSQNSRKTFIETRHQLQKSSGAVTLIRTRQHERVLKEFVQTPEFNELQDRGYRNCKGVSYGIVKGLRVMFVSGSRNAIDWLFNLVDAYVLTEIQAVSNFTAYKLTKQYRRDLPDLVVGHSRGSALVAKMDIPENRKLSVDGAMVLSPWHATDMMNLYQKTFLDRFLSRGGTNQMGFHVKDYNNYHFISRDVSIGSEEDDNEERLDETHKETKSHRWFCMFRPKAP